MRFEDWEPHYTAILEYFGFEREADEEAARVLAAVTQRRVLTGRKPPDA